MIVFPVVRLHNVGTFEVGGRWERSKLLAVLGMQQQAKEEIMAAEKKEEKMILETLKPGAEKGKK